jgi:transposase
VYYALEADFTLVLANAHHVKQVPGRKTDVRDSAWLAQLVEHGLIRGSFVPPPPIRALRDLTRSRTALMQERVRVVNRLHKVLEDTGVKLATVASNIVGASGRAMLTALAAGATEPTVLAELARGRLRQKLPALRAALCGDVRGHHRVLIAQALGHLDYLDEMVAMLSAEITEYLRPFAQARALVTTIPGITDRVADTVLAEIGVDMAPFPSAPHLASWAGTCPGQHESAGKRKGGKMRRGNRWLRGALYMSATAAVRARDAGALGARYRRVLRRRGHAKALRAVAHAQLLAVYHVLTRQVPYSDVAARNADQRAAEHARRRAIRLHEREGYRVLPAA